MYHYTNTLSYCDRHLEMAGFKYHYTNTLSQTVTRTLKWLVLSTITLILYTVTHLEMASVKIAIAALQSIIP